MSILSASQFQTSQSHNYTHEICLFKYYRIYLHFIESTDLNIVKEATIDRTSRCSISFKRWSDGFFLICASDFLESLTLHLLLQPFPMWVRTQLLEQRIKGCVLASNFEEKKNIYIYIYMERERGGGRDKTFVYYHRQSAGYNRRRQMPQGSGRVTRSWLVFGYWRLRSCKSSTICSAQTCKSSVVNEKGLNIRGLRKQGRNCIIIALCYLEQKISP